MEVYFDIWPVSEETKSQSTERENIDLDTSNAFMFVFPL